MSTWCLGIIRVVACSTLLLAAASPAPAGPAEEVAAVTQAWAEAMSQRDLEAVVAMYDQDAVLWGTRSPVLRDSPAMVRDYFRILETVPPSYKVVLGEHRIRVYGDMAIDTGSYTFSEMRDGKLVSRPSRFSMVFRHHDGRWWIVDHHSSLAPAAP